MDVFMFSESEYPEFVSFWCSEFKFGWLNRFFQSFCCFLKPLKIKSHLNISHSEPLLFNIIFFKRMCNV